MDGVLHQCEEKILQMKRGPQNLPTESRQRLVAALHLRKRPRDCKGDQDLLEIQNLPFGLEDVTAGVENELQAVVKGNREEVDLPIVIEQSNYYANLAKRFLAGETSRQLLTQLEDYLQNNRKGIWENSWVRFPYRVLCTHAREVLSRDLLARKSDPQHGLRTDADRFLYKSGAGETHVRVPVSYLLKLSLADFIGSLSGQEKAPPLVLLTADRLLAHFSNDNSSPETFSFYVVSAAAGSSLGESVARETLRRYLLTQLLTSRANDRFMLSESGQEAMVYFAPHPPLRQRRLNESIADGFYRELFMSPCLSGWDEGESKHAYMQLCHQVLSRSQLNGLGKLRDAGIITRNLVVLPNVSNISLANNGTHLSLGSRSLSTLLGSKCSDFTHSDEKYLGDLAIKMLEHFLPLFPGTYSASPYRMSFTDFHPEKALGFLPHELDFTHLRMIWRRWKNKAQLKVFGRPMTPFGPLWIDRTLSRIFRLRGDFVPDYRLIDYFVSLMSTETSPALDGSLENDARLKKDLAAMGVFDERMATYQLIRLREYHRMGFSGFEGRHYSLFPSLREHFSKAADLQALLTAWVYSSILKGEWTHGHIPDTPSTESERRQIFFGTAIGIPTFYVHMKTRNLFLQKILKRCPRVRVSRRYPGYWRAYNWEYRQALVGLLKDEGTAVVEAFDMHDVVRDLENLLRHPEWGSATSVLVKDALRGLRRSSPMDMNAEEFNETMEDYYRDALRKTHLSEAFEIFKEDCEELQRNSFLGDNSLRESLASILGGQGTLDFAVRVEGDFLAGTLPRLEHEKLIQLVLLIIGGNIEAVEKKKHDRSGNGQVPPICGTTLG